MLPSGKPFGRKGRAESTSRSPTQRKHVDKEMPDHDRIRVVTNMIAEHVKSPSLRHIRDHEMLWKLAGKIVERVDQARPLWRKWQEHRETLLRAAAPCWIPIEDLREYLNGMPGPALTLTDVAQRLRAVHEEPYEHYPNDHLRVACLELYAREKAQGTELPAIVGALQEFVEQEEERLRHELQERLRTAREEEREQLEQRFLSGADCKWTPVRGSKQLYCRVNGRTYRLSATHDKKWDLHRIESVDDPESSLIGKYQQRGDVTKALATVAYQPEPRW